MAYQPLDLVNKKTNFLSLPPIKYNTRGGVRSKSNDPTNFAGEDEWSEFVSGWKSSDRNATKMPITPPMFCRIMLMDELKMVLHEAFYHAQYWTENFDD
jgi:hypothetical protein